MNRSKKQLTTKLRKQMSKTIRNAQTGIIAYEGLKPDSKLQKEAYKQFPHQPPSRKKKYFSELKLKMKEAKAKGQKSVSKRTTPGTVPSDSTPAHSHREGKRWMKTLIKQNLSDRTVAAHRGRKK